MDGQIDQKIQNILSNNLPLNDMAGYDFKVVSTTDATTGDIYSIVIATRESNNSILSEIIEFQQSLKSSFKTEFNNAIDYTYTTGSVQIKKINGNSWYYVNDIASSDTVVAFSAR